MWEVVSILFSLLIAVILLGIILASVKQNVDAEWCGESIKTASVNLACEAIQVAATAQKFIDSQKEREKSE